MMRHMLMLIVDEDRDPDEPMFPLPRMDHELRYGNEPERPGSNHVGCLAIIAFVIIFWAAVIGTFVLTLK